MLLNGPNLQLIPYSPQQWQLLANWFYDSHYRNMWRHHPRALQQIDFENYPKIIGGDVFIIYKDQKPIGFTQIIPDSKTNRGIYVGILLDRAHQNQHNTHETFVILFNYAFNRLGYRKAIVEVLEEKDDLKKGALKAGFLMEGTLYGEAYIDGQFVNEVRLSMSSIFFNKHYQGVAKQWEALKT